MTAKVKAPKAVASKAKTAVLIGNESMAPPSQQQSARSAARHTAIACTKRRLRIAVKSEFLANTQDPARRVDCFHQKQADRRRWAAPDTHLCHLHSIQRHQSLLCTAEPDCFETGAGDLHSLRARRSQRFACRGVAPHLRRTRHSGRHSLVDDHAWPRPRHAKAANRVVAPWAPPSLRPRIISGRFAAGRRATGSKHLCGAGACVVEAPRLVLSRRRWLTNRAAGSLPPGCNLDPARPCGIAWPAVPAKDQRCIGFAERNGWGANVDFAVRHDSDCRLRRPLRRGLEPSAVAERAAASGRAAGAGP